MDWETCPDCLLGNRIWVSPSDLAEALKIVQAVGVAEQRLSQECSSADFMSRFAQCRRDQNLFV